MLPQISASTPSAMPVAMAQSVRRQSIPHHGDRQGYAANTSGDRMRVRGGPQEKADGCSAHPAFSHGRLTGVSCQMAADVVEGGADAAGDRSHACRSRQCD
jgi:hypothetical protein